MATINNSTVYRMLPNLEMNVVAFLTPATADSGDEIDVSTIFSTVTGVEVTVMGTGGTFCIGSFTGTQVCVDYGGVKSNKTFLVKVYGSLLKK